MLGGMLTSSSPDEPHGPYTATTDACAACHRAHSAQGANLLPARLPQSSLCFTCHDGSSAAPNVKAQYVTAPSPVPSNDPSTGSYYSHDALTPSNHTLADSNEWQDLHGAPIMNRHSECGDCHNAHKATADPAAAGPNGWSLPGALKGISGVVVTNSRTLGAAPTYQWTPGSSQTPISLEYQLCLKCHSGFTTLPAQIPGKPSAWELDKAIELNPANGSYHPIEGAGTNATTAMGQSLAGTSPYKLWTFSTSDTVRCVNCHGDPAKFDPKNPPLPGSDLAAHASQNRGLLGANYRDRLLKASLDAYAAGDFALCFSCHAEAPFTDTTGSVRDDTNFRYHGYHVANLQNAGSGGTDIDTAGAGQGNAICSECHFRIHGTALAVNAGDQWNSRLVNFAPDVIASGAAWTATGVGSGSCTLNCHGKPHTAALYDAVANPITLTVSASPVTYDAAGQAIAFTYVIGNSGAAPISGPFTVSDDHVGSPAVTPFACGSATSLDPGQTTTCTASYAITAADVSSGSVTSIAVATNGTVNSNSTSVTVSRAP